MEAAASVCTLIGAVAHITKFVHRVQHDTRNAPVEVDTAQRYVLLLQKEIDGVRRLKGSLNDERESAKEKGGVDPFGLTSDAVLRAVTLSENLLVDVERAFPIHGAPETLKERLRWALKDKRTVAKLAAKLAETEGTLQSILQVEQTRISRLMWSVLIQQSTVLARIESQQTVQHEQFNAFVIDSKHPQTLHGAVQVDINPVKPAAERKVVQLFPKVTCLDRPGLSAQLVLTRKRDGSSFGMSLRLAAFSKVYSADFRFSWPLMTFTRAMHTQNIISSESAIVFACRTGDFDGARRLLTDGQAHPNDITESKTPLLDYAIEGGSGRIVQMLLHHGSNPNLTYDQCDMTPLHAAFLRGRLDMARYLIKAGADVEHVDGDGFSVLSYLWVVEEPVKDAADFLRLCSAKGFDAVNSTDDRGWAPFHRAAAIGTAEDIEAFVQLGASLDIRTEWYGWTPLFFAASHDNVDTFEAIVRHSPPDVYQALDGDGWNLLHIAVYFGAPNVMRLVLARGIDIHQKTTPAPMPEDPELSYLELTARDLAIYMGPDAYHAYLDGLSAAGYDSTIDGWTDVFWSADGTAVHEPPADGTLTTLRSVYEPEDVDEKWSILHWACYCGSEKIKGLLLKKGAATSRHLNGITAEAAPSLVRYENPLTSVEVEEVVEVEEIEGVVEVMDAVEEVVEKVKEMKVEVEVELKEKGNVQEQKDYYELPGIGDRKGMASATITITEVA